MRQSQSLDRGLRLDLSKGFKRVGNSLFSPQDRNRYSSQSIVFSIYLEFRKMDKVQKTSDSEYYTSSSETFMLNGFTFLQVHAKLAEAVF
jgi:hypothetical protein